MKLYAELDTSKEERELFMNKILADYENAFKLIGELFEEPVAIRRKGQYDNLKWRNSKLHMLHQLHIKYLKQWREIDNDTSIEKEKMLTRLLSLINSISSGLKNTG